MPQRFESLVDMQERACRAFAYNDLFGTKIDGRYRWTTYREFGQLVDDFRGGLAGLGVGRGHKVAVIANNSVQWAVGAYATYGLGAHFVPMYEAQHPDDWDYILRDCGAKVVLTSSRSVFDRVSTLTSTIDGVEQVVCFEGNARDPYSYQRLLANGRDAPVRSIKPSTNEVAGLLYTSGTTGHPKGVVLSHGNIISNVNAVQQMFPMNEGDISCSFLPWAHAFGQTCELHCLLSRGAAIGIAQSVHTLMENFQELRPTLLFAVPRIFNRIYDGLQRKLEDAHPIQRKVFEKGLEVAMRRRKAEEAGQRSLRLEAQYAVFDRLVFGTIKERFGGRLRYCFSGGAALSREVGEFIDNLGIMVFEGYGLTETSPIATANSPDAQRLGTVGKAIPGVDIFICDDDGKTLPPDADGEVVVVGPNVMVGYHNLPEETDQVIFDLDGLRAFRTGDMGRKSADGFVTITGRFKEQYKLENGKYVVPTPLEDKLKLSRFINQVFLYGDNRPYNICLVVPDFEVLARWAAEQGISAGSAAALASDPRVHRLIGQELSEHDVSFKGYEKPKRWALVAEEFTVDNGLLTPKLSIKRRNVVEAHRDTIERLYADD